MMTHTHPNTILEPEILPHVALDFMNKTHFEEIEMVKNLSEIIFSFKNSDKHRDYITEKLNTWHVHTIAHFERENKLMREIKFPAYAIHANEHKIALNQLKEVINAWSENQDINSIKDYILTLWPVWFVNHVNTMDMMTAKFAVMNGYTNHKLQEFTHE